MRLLADTHAVYWYAAADPQLSSTARTRIEDPANEILLSPASYWEMAIKVSLGKWVLHRPYEEFIDVCLNQYGFVILPVEPKHTAALTTLPFHHRDPFDRLIVAQAIVEAIPVISADTQLDAYGINRIW